MVRKDSSRIILFLYKTERMDIGQKCKNYNSEKFPNFKY